VKEQVARGNMVTVWSQKPTNVRYIVWALWIPLNGCYATMIMQPVGEELVDPFPAPAQHLLTVEARGEIPDAANKWLEEATKAPALKAPAPTPLKPPKKKARKSIGVLSTSAATSATVDQELIERIAAQVAANGRVQAAELGRQIVVKIDEMSELIANKVVQKIAEKYDKQLQFLHEQNTNLVQALSTTATAAATAAAARH